MKQAILGAVSAAMMIGCGVEGPEGPQGEPGPSIAQSVAWHCSDGYGSYHNVYQFPDGAVMVSCEMEWTIDGVSSGFNIWRPEQQGAATGYCQLGGSGSSWAEFTWNGNTRSLLTVHGSSVQSYQLNCTKS